MTFSGQIIDILDYIGSKLGIAIDWTGANVLPYIQELCGRYISYEIVTSIAWIAIAGVCLLISFLIKNKCDWDGFEQAQFAVVLGVSIMVCAIQIFDIIRCCYLPEAQIYNYLKGLLGQN